MHNLNEARLTAARTTLAKELKRKAEATRIEQRQQQRIADEQAKFGELKRKHASIDNDVAAAEAALVTAEEAALERWCVEFAAETIKLHTADPLRNSKRVIANVDRLRKNMRSEVDTPRGQEYQVHPVVMQALALQPKPSDVDRPVYELGVATTPWAWRRREILESIYPNPLEAA
jgi:hypothetical protein